MLFGNPQRALTSRSGSASPDDRNAESTCAACTTDLTRYGSRVGVSRLITTPASTSSELPLRFRHYLSILHGCHNELSLDGCFAVRKAK